MKNWYEKYFISCKKCSHKMEDEIRYVFSEQQDDFVILECPKCHHKISLDDIKMSGLLLVDWVYNNFPQVYKQASKEIFLENE